MTLRYSLNKRRSALVLTTLAIGTWITGQTGLVTGVGAVLERNQPGLYKIDHFIDGDTIAVDMDGHAESVRFIGIDTPETHKPDTPVQCYGPEAAAFTKATIGRSKVRLVSDSLSTDRDRYDRLLRYVYLPDGTLLNEELVREGYAFYYPYFPFAKSAAFEADEKAAMAARKGLWPRCHPTPTDAGGYVSNPQG